MVYYGSQKIRQDKPLRDQTPSLGAEPLVLDQRESLWRDSSLVK